MFFFVFEYLFPPHFFEIYAPPIPEIISFYWYLLFFLSIANVLH